MSGTEDIVNKYSSFRISQKEEAYSFWRHSICLVKCESERRSVMSDSLQPHGLYNPWNSPGQKTGVDSLSLLQGDLSNPGIKPRPPALQADSLPAEPQGKSKNTGVGSLSLHQQIFLTQELNWGLLHCRWVLYWLSYQGSPGWSARNSKYKIIFLYLWSELRFFVLFLCPFYFLSKNFFFLFLAARS